MPQMPLFICHFILTHAVFQITFHCFQGGDEKIFLFESRSLLFQNVIRLRILIAHG